ncbi:hypothetical protein NDU88_005671 [Pleurodeles waltl]|uniref:Uncharacterized protein n=1 Tax=Pleurodeles waltl TaxID=8319 RepID=A0AAV7UIP3_PLEWA|nr:hypothetical protein NDU88_005671 [Pleurodeles waltl]
MANRPRRSHVAPRAAFPPVKRRKNGKSVTPAPKSQVSSGPHSQVSPAVVIPLALVAPTVTPVPMVATPPTQQGPSVGAAIAPALGVEEVLVNIRNSLASLSPAGQTGPREPPYLGCRHLRLPLCLLPHPRIRSNRRSTSNNPVLANSAKEGATVALLSRPEKKPELGTALIYYTNKILKAQHTYGGTAWLEYDRDFRWAKVEDPSIGWDQTEVNVWLECVNNKIPGTQPFCAQLPEVPRVDQRTGPTTEQGVLAILTDIRKQLSTLSAPSAVPVVQAPSPVQAEVPIAPLPVLQGQGSSTAQIPLQDATTQALLAVSQLLAIINTSATPAPPTTPWASNDSQKNSVAELKCQVEAIVAARSPTSAPSEATGPSVTSAPGV